MLTSSPDSPQWAVARGQLGRRDYSDWIPNSVWAPLAAGLLILIVGAIGLIAHQPWLFPSLGPTAFVQAEKPEQPTARIYNVIVRHLHGLVAGFLAVWLLQANAAPAVLSNGDLTAPRVWASVLAVALNMLFGFLLKASHPPASATTLLIALGGFKPTFHDALTIMIGVIILAIAGELLRQIRLGRLQKDKA
jgi:CBS-domain-containing membrane protein